MQLHVFSDYTYTLETIIQAGQKRMAIASVPIRVNGELRPSRLVKSIPSYVRRSIVVIARIFLTYRPFAAFATMASVALVPGLMLAGRFLWLYWEGGGRGHVQSVVLAALLLGSGLFLLVVGVIVDLISVNRKLLEGIDLRLRCLEHDSSSIPASGLLPRPVSAPKSEREPESKLAPFTLQPHVARRG
jgi:hypothetical protein